MELLPNTDANWSLAKKILFRFVCVYIVMYALSHPFGMPLGQYIGEYYSLLWDSPVLWVGKQVFGVDITVRPAGSGDTTFNYVQIFSMGVLSAFLCLLWSLIDWERRNYKTLLGWLVIFVRYYLAFVMLTYGLVKVIKLQFPYPTMEMLDVTYGNSSPMRLLWTFMGYSESYTIFAGLGEVIGGLLLFFRRTTTLGALVVLGVMGNVAVMNFSYDVPVKLFSTHLVLFALCLLSLDLRRVLNVFVLNRAAPPADLSLALPRPWMQKVRVALKVLVIGYVLYAQVSGALEARALYGSERPKPALYGLYEVETFVQNGDTLAPLITDPVRWRKLMVDRVGFVTIKKMDDQIERFASEIDTVAQTLTFNTFADTTQKYVLQYTRPSPDTLLVEGVLMGDSVSIHMKRFGLDRYLLVSRGFHWINEYPFNR